MKSIGIYGIGAAIAANLMSDLKALDIVRFSEPADFAKPRRRKTGKTYPHSSTRQRARYARQTDAGQIKNAA